MSSPYFPLLFSTAAFILLWLLGLLLLRVFNKPWWSVRGVRRARYIVPIVAAGALALWATGTATGVRWLITPGSGTAAALLTLLLAADIALIVSALVFALERAVQRLGGQEAIVAAAPALAAGAPAPLQFAETSPTIVRINRSRRSFVTRAASVVPAATISAASYGILRSHGAVRLPEVPLTFASLPQALDGYRILHLSDIHLGYYVDLGDLEALIESASELAPDLVIISGDTADDLAMLPDALRILAALKPRDGIFATLGNHEYFHGVDRAVRIFDAGPVPLLRNSGAAVNTGGGMIYIGGADDPVNMGQRDRNHRFLQRSVDAAFDGAPSDAFHLLVSHRPEGFDVACERDIAMTIAGHTHGAQLGFNGRSILEPFYPERYLWGLYGRGDRKLYTSAGVGHWFPFRLGCPPEAPLYILKRG